jgi:hypothetical protein
LNFWCLPFLAHYFFDVEFEILPSIFNLRTLTLDYSKLFEF